MDESRKQELMEEYVNAYNDHALEKLEEMIAPDVTVEVEGNVVQSDRDELLASFPTYWDLQSDPVDIEEMTTTDDGGMMKFKDYEGNDMEVQIFWNEDGLIIKQEITRP
jgi:hypothetical protein